SFPLLSDQVATDAGRHLGKAPVHRHESTAMTSKPALNGRSALTYPVVVLALIGASLLWAYWPTFKDLVDKWANKPEYSHGYLVPAFAGLLLWFRREQLAKLSFQPSWWGVALLALGMGVRLAGEYYYFMWFDAVSILPCLAGVALLLGGWPAL